MGGSELTVTKSAQAEAKKLLLGATIKVICAMSRKMN